MSLVRIATVGCLLLSALLAGCGDGSSTHNPIDETQPGAGEEVSKQIMDMQPPPLNKKSGRN